MLMEKAPAIRARHPTRTLEGAIPAGDVSEPDAEGVVDDQGGEEVGRQLGVVDGVVLDEESAADNQVVAGQRAQELIHLPRVVLPIGVEGDHLVEAAAAGVPDTGSQGSAYPEVLGMAKQLTAKPANDVGRGVRASIVDHHQALSVAVELAKDVGDCRCRVVGRDDDQIGHLPMGSLGRLRSAGASYWLCTPQAIRPEPAPKGNGRLGNRQKARERKGDWPAPTSR